MNTDHFHGSDNTSIQVYEGDGQPPMFAIWPHPLGNRTSMPTICVTDQVRRMAINDGFEVVGGFADFTLFSRVRPKRIAVDPDLHLGPGEWSDLTARRTGGLSFTVPSSHREWFHLHHGFDRLTLGQDASRGNEMLTLLDVTITRVRKHAQLKRAIVSLRYSDFEVA